MNLSDARLPILALLALLPAVSACAPPATAATVQGIKPEIEACVWAEDSAEVASVAINGKDVITFRSEAGAGSAAERAEDLAAKLQEMLDDGRIDVNELLPGRCPNLAAIQCKGNTVVSFDPTLAVDLDKEQPGSNVELSLKIVNGIRSACGAPAVPSTYLKLAGSGHDAAGIISGQASWYGGKFHGRRTSAGQRYDQDKMTAAHRSLPFGTKLLVMNRKTGNSCVVEINDRGPFVGDRVIDLSRGAARQLNMISSGVTEVDCLVLGNE